MFQENCEQGTQGSQREEHLLAAERHRHGKCSSGKVLPGGTEVEVYPINAGLWAYLKGASQERCKEDAVLDGI